LKGDLVVKIILYAAALAMLLVCCAAGHSQELDFRVVAPHIAALPLDFSVVQELPSAREARADQWQKLARRLNFSVVKAPQAKGEADPRPVVFAYTIIDRCPPCERAKAAAPRLPVAIEWREAPAKSNSSPRMKRQ